MPAGLSEVPVVTEPDQALPAGGIHVPVGDFGRLQGDGQRFREERADRDRVAVGVVDPAELGIGAEPRAGHVHRVQLGGEQVAGQGQRVRVGDQHGGEGAKGRERARRDRRGRRRHQPPPCDALETVGVGAGAELVDGAGAGAVLGGAGLADLDGAGAAFWPAWAAAWGAGAAAWALADAVARTRLGWAFPGEELDGAGAEGDVFAADAAVVSLATV